MNWMELVASLVRSLAWPLGIVLIVFMLKDGIAGFLSKVTQLTGKGFGVELEARRDLDVAEAAVAAAKAKVIEARGSPTELSVAVQSPPITDDDERLLELAKISPRAVVIESWMRLDAAMRAAVERLNANERTGHVLLRIHSTPDLLARAGDISLADHATIVSLRSIRNRAAHEADYELTEADAVRYWSLAREIAGRINNLTLPDRDTEPTSEKGVS